ncbi:MAG: MoxR family ATPase [Bradymonadales bacterium]|jgi:MoxR-like ATPase
MNDSAQSGAALKALKDNIAKVIIGQDDAIDLAIICLLADGHLLIEDIPGVGKTTLAKAFANSIALPITRIQFTADMLPSDIIGISVFDKEENAFKFHKGPIFTNIVLADEINRAEPRAQSALLEVMVERQISVDARIYKLTRPFMVIATQNPLDYSGTYPLPDSQRDRFLFCISLGYPSQDAERKILLSQQREKLVDSLEPVLNAEQFEHFAELVDAVHVDSSILDYILDIAAQSRQSSLFKLGISTRACIDWLRAAKARAVYLGRDFVLPDDVRNLAPHALAHRVHPSGQSTKSAKALLHDILQNSPMPI